MLIIDRKHRILFSFLLYVVFPMGKHCKIYILFKVIRKLYYFPTLLCNVVFY